MKKTNYITSKKSVIDHDDKKYYKIKYYCYYTGKCKGAGHNNCSLRHKHLKEISVVFHNGPKYEYGFIIKELTEEVKGQFECLEENTEKCSTF